MNLGRLNDDITQRVVKPLVPYIMLYNKFTGVLRVFAHLNRTSDYNTISIELNIDDKTSTNGLNYSAILSLNTELAQTLDEKSKVKTVNSISQYPNNQSLFFWADFTLAYDPCVCFNKSNMNVNFKALTQGDLTMTGTITGNIIPIASSSGNPIKNVVNAISKVGSFFVNQSYSSATDAFSSLFGLSNLSGELNNALTLFKNIIAAGQSLESLSLTNKESIQRALLSINNIFSTSIKGGSPNGANILMATAKLSGEAKFLFTFDGSTIRFSTPGSKDSQLNPEENYNNNTDAFGNKLPEYPAYNEILGTFALLKKPTINISKVPIGGDPPMYWHPDRPNFVEYSRVRFKIPQAINSNANNILYALNPIMHTNFSNTKIKVALVIRTKMWGMGGTNGNKYPLFVGLSNNHNLINLTPITANYPNLTQTITPYSYNPWDPDQIDGNRYTWDWGSNNTFSENIYEYITPLVPVDFIYDLQGEFTLFGTNFQDSDLYGVGFSPSIEDIRLKFFIDFESNDIGSNNLPNKSNLIFTYPMNINYSDEFTINPIIDLTQFRTPITAVSQNQINQFCTGILENSTYQANEYYTKVNLVNEEKSVDKKDYKKVLSVFPNPANTEITVKYELETNTFVKLSLHNIFMQELKLPISYTEKNKGVYAEKINISKLAPGTYIIKIQSKDKSESIKFIKL